MNKKNCVVSYINPDTDGVACSIALARLFTDLGEEQFRPVIFGNINDETEFVLQSLGLTCPASLLSLRDANKIILVDTHHKVQLPPTFPYDKVIMIIDHHPNGDESLFDNASIDNRTIGAAASIIAEMYYSNHKDDKKMLMLLGYAILSNTLNFTAPSTTDFDKQIFMQIHSQYPILEEAISKMFHQRVKVLEKGMYEALLSDFKMFETRLGPVGIAQLEIYDLISFVNIEEISKILDIIAKEKRLSYCMFNGVDIKTRKSLVVFANKESRELACEIFATPIVGNHIIFDRILLRKTEFIPNLN